MNKLSFLKSVTLVALLLVCAGHTYAQTANKAKKIPSKQVKRPQKNTLAKKLTIPTISATKDTLINVTDSTAKIKDEGDVLILKEAIDKENPKEEDVKIFDIVEQMPEFSEEYTVAVIDPVTNTARTKTLSGQAALLKWIGDHIKYPTIAEENGIQGRVVCTFVVERDGSVTDVQVARSIDPTLDMEAVRVLKEMPKWKPGRHKGENVRVKYTVPVTFKLQ